MQKKTNDDLNPLLTINDLSILLKVKQSWIRSQVFQRKIPFVKVGNHVRFRVSDIELWINSQSNGPAPPN